MPRRTSGRIKRITNPKEILDVATTIYQEHLNDGPASPLYNLTGINWDEIGQLAMTGAAYHQSAEEHKRKMEELYRERDNIVEVVAAANNATKALLKAMYPKNPKKLSDWGYNIDDSKPPKKEGVNTSVAQKKLAEGYTKAIRVAFFVVNTP